MFGGEKSQLTQSPIIKFIFILLMAKLNLLQPLFQSSVSHDPSDIIQVHWFAAQETFPIITSIKNSCSA